MSLLKKILFLSCFSMSHPFLRRSCGWSGIISGSRSISKSAFLLLAKKKSVILETEGGVGISGRKKNNLMHGLLISPKTENQKIYHDYLSSANYSIVVSLGPAGSGKTLMACSHAAINLKSGVFDRIIITRPMVSVENENVGFLPGNLVSKMDPWTRPVFDSFRNYYSLDQIHSMVREGIIEICPLAYMRGRTFHRSFIIADEMQNSSPNQMLMLATRIGEYSKMVITGDLNQSDIVRGENGLADLVGRLEERKKLEKRNLEESSCSGIGIVKFNQSDVIRSKIVSQIIDIYSGSSKGSSSGLSKGSSSGLSKGSSNVSNSVTNNSAVSRRGNDDAALIPKTNIPKNKLNW